MATIAQARAWLAESNLSPNDRTAAEAEIAAAVADGTSLAAGVLSAARIIVHDIGSGGFDLSVEVRDEAVALTESIRSGRTTPADAREQLHRITARLAEAADHRERFERAAESITEIEADPEAWADRLHEKYPTLQPRFSWMA